MCMSEGENERKKERWEGELRKPDGIKTYLYYMLINYN